jgi:lipid-A-disaccharide synthase
LLEHLADLRPSADEERLREASPPLVLALPGSRSQEVERLAPMFGETLGMLAARSGPFEVVLPTVPHLVTRLLELTSRWPIRPRIVIDEAEKYAAFRRARAALAASGTVTLELALAGVPSVAAYRIPALEGAIFRMVRRMNPVSRIRSIILANLVLDEWAIPEFVQRDCTAEKLAAALIEILGDTPSRAHQIEAFKRLETIMGTSGVGPSMRAAQAVLDLLQRRSAMS